MCKLSISDKLCSFVNFACSAFVCMFVWNGNELVTLSYVSDLLESFPVHLACIFILLNTSQFTVTGTSQLQ